MKPAAASVAPPSKRDAVLDAALELFGRRTFGATPVPEIAARANVGAGTVYRYFASKEELANELFRTCKRRLHETLAGALASATDPHEQFAMLWKALAHFATEQPSALRFLEMQHHDEYLDAESRGVSDEVFTTAARFIRSGQAAGAIRRGDAGLLIALVFGAFVGMVKEAEQGRFRLTDQAVERSSAMVWKMLAA